jgi:hypothetical protein
MYSPTARPRFGTASVPLAVDIGAVHLGRELAQTAHKSADTAPDVEDALVVEVNVAAEEVEASLQAWSPYLAGMAENRALIGGTGRYVLGGHSFRVQVSGFRLQAGVFAKILTVCATTFGQKAAR